MRHMLHLVRRFASSLRPAPLDPAEQEQVTTWLTGELHALFFAQPPLDQRHALSAARHVAGVRPGDRELVAAALLHDVGKRHAGLGVLGRSAATALQLLRIPAGAGRMGAYLDHGSVGAAELGEAGASPRAVVFARSHHRRTPPEDWPGGAAEWEVLVAADHA